MFIDVHCHIDSYSDREISEIVEKARDKEVKVIVNNGTCVEKNRRCLELGEKYNEIKCALGIYPIDALSMSDEEIDEEIDFIRKNSKKIVAIGEVGIDYKEDNENRDRQKETFKKFIKLSMELNKPIIIHSRKAEKEVIDILEEMKAKKVIMHCFCGNMKLVDRIKQNGWFITIPSNVKNSEQFQLIAKNIPLNQLLCETDSPFLHPDKERLNTPENVVVSYNKIAEIKYIEIDEVEKQILKNYQSIFD